jgi:sterol 3beta-glucosyltransferase
MAAVVHHGGAGTTAAGLRAGRPTLVCPFIVDQPFWGRRVHEIGAGPTPIAQRALGTDVVARALRQLVDDERFRKNAESIGESLRREDSMTQVVDFIEAQLAAPRS